MLQPTVVTGVAIERQQKLLAHIRETPLGSYVFSGPPGVGKTTLLREAERCARLARPNNFPAYSQTMPTFQRDTTAAARGERIRGLVNARCIVQDARWGTWGIFLDDFDKVSGSEFIRLHLFELINAICETKSQLVLTTNMNRMEFLKFFGDALTWRIGNHCHWVEMARELAPVG